MYKPKNFYKIIRQSFLVIVTVCFSVTFITTAYADDSANVVRGGLLYDKWYGITNGDIPSGTNPAYPDTSKKKGKDSWRCKECHGWDYQGNKGAYGNKSNSHFTNYKGIAGAMGADTGKIMNLLKDKNHNYTDKHMTATDFMDLALFVSKGQVDVPKYIGLNKAVKGDAKQGEIYYNTICVNCHGFDGKKIKDMPNLGKVAQDNPWETLHKIRMGQPGEKMPALYALPIQVSVDIVAHALSLPRE
ncbi:MAG: c-type cytochrome [Rhodospirillales bacterium]|nr:c-type cytochrome [Rhodospirillales bacterium]